MALNAYLTLKGQKQGPIVGGVTQRSREGSILVHAYSNEIVSPRDPQSGLPTGQRQHHPITILKEVDRSSPALWTAFVNNENLVTWELRFWSASPSPNSESQTYTVTLTNASIASIHESMMNNEDPTETSIPLLEEITFTYQKIQWNWNDPPFTAADDWETRV